MNKIIFLIIFCLVIGKVFAQTDSSVNKVDSFLIHQKGLVGKLARNLVSNKPSHRVPRYVRIFCSADIEENTSGT